MSKEVPTNSELVAEVIAAVDAVLAARAMILEQVNAVATHNADPEAHHELDDRISQIASQIATGAFTGILSDSVTSSSSTTAASSKAVKTAYDYAKTVENSLKSSNTEIAAVKTTASNAVKRAGDTMTGALMLTAPANNANTNQAATCAWVNTTIAAKIAAAWVNATTSKNGIVKPDGTTITIDSTGKISVNAVTTATAGAIVKRNSDGTITGTITGNANWADLAEKYTCASQLEVGDVVTVSPEPGAQIAKAGYGDFVLGVVSRDPAIVLNVAEPGYPVARIGIVDCKVKGPVRKGERLAVHGAGVGCRAGSRRSFGFALEDVAVGEIKLAKVIL